MGKGQERDRKGTGKGQARERQGTGKGLVGRDGELNNNNIS